MRSIKREKYGKKELERLKGILDKAKDQDVEMKDLYTGKLDNLVLLFFFLVHTSALFDTPPPPLNHLVDLQLLEARFLRAAVITDSIQR